MVIRDSNIANNRDFGLQSTGDGTSLTLLDSVVEHNASAQNSKGVWRAWGVSSVEGTLSVERSALVSNEGFGVFSHEPGTTVTVLDSVIAQTTMMPDGEFGHGMHIWGGVNLTVERVAVVDNQHVGMFIAREGTTGTARSVLVSGTRALPGGKEGPGIGIWDQAEFLLEDSMVVNNHMAGVFVISATAALRRSVLSGTAVSEENLDPESQFGDGLIARNATLEIEDVYANGNERAGMLLDTSTGLVTASLIRENAIGLATQGTTYPSLSEINLVLENTQNRVENASLAIPSEAMMLPDG